MGAFDASGKRAVHLYAQAWAEWILAQQAIEFEAELSGDFQFVARSTDVLLQVKNTAEGRFLILIEFQTRYDPNMARRLAAYAALAREKYRMEVYVVVVYLTPPSADKSLADLFHSDFMGQTVHQDFEVIPLWELDAGQALALNNPVLLPFVPLMRDGDNVRTLRTCANRIRQEPQAEELETLLGALASLVMNPDVVREITRWSMQILKDSPLYRDLVMPLEEAIAEASAEARTKALKEGREEGREAALLLLRRFLAFRFHIPEESFDDRLQALDLATIKQLGNKVVDAKDRVDFEETLNQLVQASQPNHTSSEGS
jgi:predicted transposase YdaD